MSLSPESFLLIGASLAVAFLIALAITPAVIKFSKRFGFVDVPKDNRRMHNHPVPLLGGISIIAAFFIAALVAGLLARPLNQNSLPLYNLAQLLPGALIIVVMSMLDDKYDLPALPRLFVQCIAAGITVALGVRVTTISASVTLFHTQTFSLGWLSVPLTVIWIVGITNAFNWIDGLDGLAAGISSISCVCMLLIAIVKPENQHLSIAIPAAALAGGCLGLLPYNKNPARIFMGDTGAMFLGFTLSVLSIQGLFKFYTAISFSVPLLVLALPILDAATTIIRRVAEGKSPSTPDRSHIHHKLIDMGLSQKQAVVLLYTISTVLGIVAILFACFGTTVGWRFFLAGILVILILFVLLLHGFRRYNVRVAAHAAATHAKETAQAPAGGTLSEQSENNDRRVLPVSLGFVKSFIIRGEKIILVDAGIKGSDEKIIEALGEQGIAPGDISLIIVTHAHADHFGGLRALREFTDAPVAVHKSEADFLKKGLSAPVVVHGLLFRLFSSFFRPAKIGPVRPDILVDEQLDLRPFGVQGEVIHTPGHTAGSLSVLLSGGEAIVGDLIGGRKDASAASLPAIYTDLPALKASIRAVIKRNPQRIYTAHGGIYTSEAAQRLCKK